MSTEADFREFLPPLILDFERIIGLQAAIEIAERWPGVRLFIPANPGQDHPISLCIGWAKARDLAAEYGGEYVLVPKLGRYWKARRNAVMLERYRAGETARKLALEYGLREDTVYDLVASEQARAQGDLFSEVN